MDKQLDINPQTKIGELLEFYPQLEEVLIKLSPTFAKLKNPVLRKTVGRIASLRQAAEIGGIDIGTMISNLRRAVNQTDDSISESTDCCEERSRPLWIEENKISVIFDASPMIDNGRSPMAYILEKAEQLIADEIMLLIAPFKPVPIIELLTSKGYITWSEPKDGKVYVYLKKVG